jgi:hypothetical protein
MPVGCWPGDCANHYPRLCWHLSAGLQQQPASNVRRASWYHHQHNYKDSSRSAGSSNFGPARLGLQKRPCWTARENEGANPSRASSNVDWSPTVDGRQGAGQSVPPQRAAAGAVGDSVVLLLAQGLTITHLLACAGRFEELFLVTQAVQKLYEGLAPLPAKVFKR